MCVHEKSRWKRAELIVVGDPRFGLVVTFTNVDEMKSLQFRDGAPDMMTLESAATTMTTTAAALAMSIALLP